MEKRLMELPLPLFPFPDAVPMSLPWHFPLPLVRSANCFGSALDEDMKFEELNLSFPEKRGTWKKDRLNEKNVNK